MDLDRFTAAWQTYEHEPLHLKEADFQVLAAFDPPLEQRARARQRQAQVDLIAAKSAPAAFPLAKTSPATATTDTAPTRSPRSAMDTKQLAAVVSSAMENVLVPVLERIAQLEATVSQIQRDTNTTTSR